VKSTNIREKESVTDNRIATQKKKSYKEACAPFHRFTMIQTPSHRKCFPVRLQRTKMECLWNVSFDREE